MYLIYTACVDYNSSVCGMKQTQILGRGQHRSRAGIYLFKA